MKSGMVALGFTAGAAFLAALPALSSAFAASHREAPLIAFEPAADNTDTYAFVSYDEDNLERSPEDRRVTLIMNVNPGQEPGDGPNYFNFDDNVTYSFHIDNDADGVEDIVYEFRFETETRPALGAFELTGPLPYIGNPDIPVLELQGITALDGVGSEGLTRRQTYTVTEWRDEEATELFRGETLVAVPSNVGPATMPDYEDLASQGIYEDHDVRVFAGQRAETFYIDLGAVFDTLNLRRSPPLLTAVEDADDSENPFGVNRFSGFNVSTIALEVPITAVTENGLPAGEEDDHAGEEDDHAGEEDDHAGEEDNHAGEEGDRVIGIYASTSRHENLRVRDDGTIRGRGPQVQRSRLANALVNELLIDTPDKDRWNASEPEDEAQFQEFFKNPTLATELNLVFGFPVPATPRTDLMQLFLKYPGQLVTGDGDCGSPCAELLRLDLTVPPVRAEDQERMTVFAHDPGGIATPDLAGFPNGRRPNDDVTDIAIRVVGGAAFIANFAGDGVNNVEDAPGAGTDDGPGYGSIPGNRLDVTDNGIAKEFPFLPTPHDGRNRQHIDCDEEGANSCDE